MPPPPPEELDGVFPVLHSSKIECLRGPCAPCTYLLTHARTLTLLSNPFYLTTVRPSAHFLPPRNSTRTCSHLEALRAMGKQEKQKRGEGVRKVTVKDGVIQD